MSNPNTSGLTNAQQAFLTSLALALTSLGTLTAAIGAFNNTQMSEIVGVIVVIGGIIAIFLKEYVGILSGNIPPAPAKPQ